MMQPDLRLYFVRHGHAEANRPWLFLGRTDSPLSDDGHKEAESVAVLLAEAEIDLVYTSPLLRALTTARVIGASKELSPIVDERLVEQDYGVWEGLTLDEVRVQYPDEHRGWQAGGPEAGPTDGETLAQLSARAHRFCVDLYALPASSSVAVVSHGSMLNALLSQLFGIPQRWLWPFRLDTGTVSEVWLHGTDATLVSMSQR